MKYCNRDGCNKLVSQGMRYCVAHTMNRVTEDKQKHEQYEVIWQIGDIEDTGYENNFYDSLFAEKVEYGAMTWIEKQKEWIADYKQKELGWSVFFRVRMNVGICCYRITEENELLNEPKKLGENGFENERKSSYGESVYYFKLDEMLTDKKKNLEEVNDKVRYYDRKLDSVKKEPAVVEDDYKVVSNKLEEKSRKAEIAEEVYFMYSGSVSDREHNLFEEVVQLQYEKQKLNDAYEFMKRFMIVQITLFEKFIQRVEEKVRDFVVIRYIDRKECGKFWTLLDKISRKLKVISLK